jgi:H+/Cl- antiporter ClcA
MEQQAGKYIIIAGICLVLAGAIVYLFHDHFKWLGRLPGDIRIENENSRFYFPVVTMLIISLVVTVCISIIRRLL